MGSGALSHEAKPVKNHRPRVGALFLIGFLGYLLNRYQILPKTLDWIDGFGFFGPAVFLIIYVIAAVFFIPSFIFTFSGGILFGLGWGFILSAVGSALGALSAFCIGRYLAHDFVEKKFSDNQHFHRLAQAVQTRGWKIILLARLSPIFPFSIGNYAFGTTRIPAFHYMLASFIGTMPSTLVYTYMGVVTGDLALLGSGGRQRSVWEWLLLGGGLIATLVLAWYLKKMAEKDIRST